jgi:hypothetical protein
MSRLGDIAKIRMSRLVPANVPFGGHFNICETYFNHLSDILGFLAFPT